MKYVVEKSKGRRYWQPKKRYFLNGKWQDCPFRPVSLPKGASWIAVANDLNREFDKWRQGQSVVFRHARGSVGWLIAQYKKDDRFLNLEKTTQKKNMICLNSFTETYGDVPADKISRMVARAYCVNFAAKSRQALQAAVCRILYNFGRDIGAVKENPFDAMRLARMRPRQEVWTMELIAAVQSKATEEGCKSIALAVQMGLDTGQRAGDLRSLTWAAYTGQRLRFRQSKTKVFMEVPVMQSLKVMLDKADRQAPAILICEATGKPYNKDMLSRKFREICDKVPGVGNLQFRDLRRTAVVRLAEHGCTNAEIAAITGHSLQDTVNILEVYLPRNSTMAENAIAKLEKK